MPDKSSNAPGWMMFWGVVVAAVGMLLLAVGAGWLGVSRSAELVANRGAALMILGSLLGLVGWLLDVARNTSV